MLIKLIRAKILVVGNDAQEVILTIILAIGSLSVYSNLVSKVQDHITSEGKLIKVNNILFSMTFLFTIFNAH